MPGENELGGGGMADAFEAEEISEVMPAHMHTCNTCIPTPALALAPLPCPCPYPNPYPYPYPYPNPYPYPYPRPRRRRCSTRG